MTDTRDIPRVANAKPGTCYAHGVFPAPEPPPSRAHIFLAALGKGTK